MKKYIIIFLAVFAVILSIGYFGGFFSIAKHDHAGHDHSGHDHAAEAKKADAHAGHDHSGHDHAAEAKKADAHAGHDHGAEAEGGVTLTPEQAKHVKVTVSKAALGSVNQRLELHGEVKLNADRTAKIMQRVPGFVTQVCAKQGDKVKKGDLLARLASEKLGEHYSNYFSGKALEEVAKSEFNMASKLYANKAMSEKEYLRYKRDYIDAGIARRKAESILRSLELDPEHRDHKHAGNDKSAICTEYDIVSPISGVVVAKDIAPGEKYADDNTQVLFMVSDIEKLWLELRADYKELKAVRPGMDVEVTPLAGDGKTVGKVIYVSQIVDEASRKGFVRVELDSRGGNLCSGEFALGAVKLDSERKAVVVPRQAVQLVSGERVVFVPVKGSFITRVVKVGDAAGDKIEVVSGLSVGEEYVSDGAFSLKSIMLTSGMDPHAGHGH